MTAVVIKTRIIPLRWRKEFDDMCICLDEIPECDGLLSW